MSFTSAILFPLLALSSTALAANHEVRVGPGLTFTPANTNAEPADTITFTFAADTHDVVQGAFSSPCAPVDGGFYTGFLSPDNNFVVTVNDTNPIWFYCSAGRHCQSGMVGGVNLPSSSTESLQLYIAASARAGDSGTPAAVAGGVVSSADEEPSASASASASASGSVSASSSASSTPTASSAVTSPSATTANSAGVSIDGKIGGLLGAGAVLVSLLMG